MGKILFISLLFCSLWSKGQIDSNYWYHGLTVESIDSSAIRIDTFSFLSSLSKSGVKMKDTVPIILLVCDTTHYVYYTPYAFSGNSFDKAGMVSWVKGYAERTLVYGNIPCSTSGGVVIAMNCMGWSSVSETYLDADKKPLSKNIIVWLSKDIINQ